MNNVIVHVKLAVVVDQIHAIVANLDHFYLEPNAFKLVQMVMLQMLLIEDVKNAILNATHVIH